MGRLCTPVSKVYVRESHLQAVSIREKGAGHLHEIAAQLREKRLMEPVRALVAQLPVAVVLRMVEGDLGAKCRLWSVGSHRIREHLEPDQETAVAVHEARGGELAFRDQVYGEIRLSPLRGA